MWSDDVRQNLAKELEKQLDNKEFFDAKSCFDSNSSKKVVNKNSSTIMYSSMITSNELLDNKKVDYNSAIKGMAFSNKPKEKNDSNYYENAMSFKNKIQPDKKINTIDDLSIEDRKIYKMADILNADLLETIVFPIPKETQNNVSLALIKKVEWKEILFSDVSDAWKMIKNKFNR